MSEDFGLVYLESAVFLLALIPMGILVFRRLQTRSQRAALLERQAVLPPQAANVSHFNDFRWRAAILLLVLLLSGIAALRPYLGFEDIELSIPGREIAVVVDVSNSMLTTDVSPSRIGLVRRKLEDLLRLLKKEGRRDRISLTVFAGSAQLFAPLTADHVVMRSFIKALSPDLVVQGGSNLMGGISEALESFGEMSSQPRLMLVFSDGGEDALDTDDLQASFAGTPIRTVFLGLGTLEGARVILPTGQPVVSNSGSVVVSRLNEELLRQAAEASNGSYLRVRPDDGDLLRALQILRESEQMFADGGTAPSSVRVFGELGPLLLKIVLIVLLVSVGFGYRRVIFPVVLMCALATGAPRIAFAQASPALSDTTPPDLETKSGAATGNAAWRAYDEERYGEAEALFEELIEVHRDMDSRVLQGLGSAQFKQQKFSEAERSFSRAVEQAETSDRAFDGHYNRGNALLALGKFDEAIAEYDRALGVFPEEPRATHNKQVAQKLKKQDPPPQSQSQTSSSASLDQNSSANSSSNESAEGSQNSSGSESSKQASGAQESANEDSQSSMSPGSDNSSSEGRSPGSSQSDSSNSSTQGASENSQSASAPAPSSMGASSSSAAEGSEQSASGRSGSSYSSGSANEEFRGSEELPKHDPEALRRREAEEWLETLPDSPMLSPRDSRRPQRQGSYTW